MTARSIAPTTATIPSKRYAVGFLQVLHQLSRTRPRSSGLTRPNGTAPSSRPGRRGSSHAETSADRRLEGHRAEAGVGEDTEIGGSPSRNKRRAAALRAKQKRGRLPQSGGFRGPARSRAKPAQNRTPTSQSAINTAPTTPMMPRRRYAAGLPQVLHQVSRGLGAFSSQRGLGAFSSECTGACSP
jgi:hypothetical protein